MADGKMEQLEQALGFSVPSYRPDYENQRTDYGIGIIGLHWVVQIMHLPAYKSARFNTVAAAEINEDRIREIRDKGWDIPVILDDWRALIERDDVDVIDCSFGHTPGKQELKMEVVRAAAAAGKALMVHKPVATSLRLAEEMVQVGRDAGVPLACNQNARYNPACYAVKQLLTPERMGAPSIVEVRNFWQGKGVGLDNTTGSTVGHTIHQADLFRWWVGQPCVNVYAKFQQKSTLGIYEFEGGTTVYHHEGHSGVKEHETYFRVMTERGVIKGQHNWNWHYPSSKPYQFVDVYPTPDEAVSVPLPEHVYEPVWSDINPYSPLPGAYYDLAGPTAGMMGTMGSLMRAVETGEAPDNDISGAVESLRMCLAAQMSARTGKPVDPRDVPLDTDAEN